MKKICLKKRDPSFLGALILADLLAVFLNACSGGGRAVEDWVRRHAADFREYWERKASELDDEEVAAVIGDAFYETGEVALRAGHGK